MVKHILLFGLLILQGCAEPTNDLVVGTISAQRIEIRNSLGLSVGSIEGDSREENTLLIRDRSGASRLALKIGERATALTIKDGKTERSLLLGVNGDGLPGLLILNADRPCFTVQMVEDGSAGMLFGDAEDPGVEIGHRKINVFSGVRRPRVALWAHEGNAGLTVQGHGRTGVTAVAGEAAGISLTDREGRSRVGVVHMPEENVFIVRDADEEVIFEAGERAGEPIGQGEQH